jgi:hypothetical protein
MACSGALYGTPVTPFGRLVVVINGGAAKVGVVATLLVLTAWGTTTGAICVTMLCIVATSVWPRNVMSAESPGAR